MLQNDWRWCRKCQGLFFGGHPTAGSCPAGGSHDKSQSGNYHLLQNDPTYPCQDNWRWCRKCEGLFFAGSATSGVCPAGADHDPSASGNYMLIQNFPDFPGQNNWRWCHKCQGLFFAGNNSPGACPAGGGHDSQDSGDYYLSLDGPPPVGFDHPGGTFKTKLCPGGEWTTLEWSVNQPVKAVFLNPPGAEIEIGKLFFGTDHQVLDGVNQKSLETSLGKIQIRPKTKSFVTYAYFPTGWPGTIIKFPL
jgi:hypothetical protein